jgi:hypothetical protein
MEQNIPKYQYNREKSAAKEFEESKTTFSTSVKLNKSLK